MSFLEELPPLKPSQPNGINAFGANLNEKLNNNQILCSHCGRTNNNEIRCQGKCISDTDY